MNATIDVQTLTTWEECALDGHLCARCGEAIFFQQFKASVFLKIGKSKTASADILPTMQKIWEGHFCQTCKGEFELTVL